jgi:aquaporin Z
VSGGALNPAVALGIDLGSSLYSGHFGWSCWYIVYQLVGGAVATGVYRACRNEEWAGQERLEISKYVAEFVGTFFLVLSVGLNVLPKNDLAALSIASTLMCFIYALGDVSGAHFNPAVSVAVLISGRNKIEPAQCAIYIVVQLLGGIAAGLLYYAVYGETFPLGPGLGHGWGAVGAAEITFTALLCYVVLCVATLKDGQGHKDVFGLAIGMCVTVGGFAIGGVSGGNLNPAVSVGIDTSHAIAAHGAWKNCLGYIVFQIIGGALAAGLFFITHNKKEYGVQSSYAPKIK